MKTSFNLLPSDYMAHPPSLWRRLCGRYAAFFLLALCCAEFSVFAVIKANQLKERRKGIFEEGKVALEETSRLNQRCAEQISRRKIWQSLFDGTRASIPAAGLLAAIYELLPETGAIDHLSVDGERCAISGVFANPDDLTLYMNALRTLRPYGPFVLIERRPTQRGAFTFRTEAPRRKP